MDAIATVEKQPNSNLLRGRWKKVESGNPKGRKPKAECLVSCIKDEITKLSLNKLLTNEQLIAQALVHKALIGDLKAIELILNYTHGKPKESVDMTTNGQSMNQTTITVVSEQARAVTEAIING
jgi:hypothetical protein